MTRDTFEAFARKFFDECYEMLVAKGKDYAREDNPFHNFETTAEFTGQTPAQVLGCHAYKHVASGYRYIRDGVVDTEGLRKRMVDLCNYMGPFLVAMAAEDKLVGLMHKYDVGPGRDVVVEAVDPYYPNRYHLYTDKNGVRVYTAEPHEEDK